jgi:hypothetical protein
MIESNNWECSLIDTPIVDGPRIEIAHDFTEIESYISKMPSVVDVLGVSEMDNTWTLHIDVEVGHKLSSVVIGRFEEVIDEMTQKDKLPVMLPSVPIDYSDEERQRCIITTKDERFTPAIFLKWIQSRFPNPVTDEGLWRAITLD